MVLVNLVAVVGLFALVKWLSDETAAGLSSWLSFIGIGSAIVFVAVAVPLRILLMRQRSSSERVTSKLQEQNSRQEFDARLVRALDMAETESQALDTSAKALLMCGTELDASILLADNSDAHLQSVVSTPGCRPESTCEVATPRSCPAVRNGHTLQFDTSDQLDCCPHLSDRGVVNLAAICVPVSIVGKSTGVVHTVRPDRPFTEDERNLLEVVARQAGQRVGMLRATQQAQLQASTDPLTGLFNRRSMENSVRSLVRDHVSFAVAICDLDHFKQLNDTFGHDTGDRALRVFSRTLRNTVRAADLVSRHGGEEFVVVLPFSDMTAAADVMDRVRLELQVALSDGRTPAFTVSVGVADTSEIDDYESLLALADERLLAAKRAGRDRVLTSAG